MKMWWITCLPHKHKDLDLDPHDPCKKPGVKMQACISSHGIKDRSLSGTCCQAA